MGKKGFRVRGRFIQNIRGDSMKFYRQLFLGVCLSFTLTSPLSSGVPKSKEEIRFTFAPIVKKVSPAVVNIYAARLVHMSPMAQDPFFQHFFGRTRLFGNTKPRVQRSLGSGVIVRGDGIVITNHHVIENAQEIKVVLQDGEEYAAKVVVKDPRTDLAALKIEAAKPSFPHLELEDADDLLVGDLVLAIGNPFGLGHTVTMGIVSGLARSEGGIEDFRSLIQTDAPINPGNSGGPLVTLEGKIVGINTAIYSKSGGSIGIGFAIPSNLVAPIIRAVDQGGKVERAWLGIAIKPQDRQKGVLIKKVYPKSPAEKAGLREGDLILEIGGHRVLTAEALKFRMATLPIGSETSIIFLRKGQKITLPLRIEVPEDVPGNQVLQLSGGASHPLAGMGVTMLSPMVAETFGLEYEGKGLVIVAVQSSMRASFLGLRPGDILLEINGVTLKTFKDLERALLGKKRNWAITFKRDGKKRQVMIRESA